MLGPWFKLRNFLLWLLVPLLIGTDAGAAQREFGVGFSRLSTADPMGGRMQVSLWYPTEVPNGVVRLGPFEFPGTRDAEPAAGPFGLVLLSHGSGGSDLGHWDTAVALAGAGFVAAAPLHPRNNFRDDLHDDRRIVLDGRPLQLSAVIDALLARETWSRRIDRKKIAAFGVSAGGYTVLAALGAARDYARTLDHCERHAEADPYCRIINGPGHAARVAAYAEPAGDAFDGRLCAAVIADPLTTPFSDAALTAMPPARLLVFRPEVENVLKADFHVSRVLRILESRDDFPDPRDIVVPKANHYAFIAPLPDAVARSVPEIASDPPGFDRAVFHDAMNGTIVAFLREAFLDCAGP